MTKGEDKDGGSKPAAGPASVASMTYYGITIVLNKSSETERSDYEKFVQYCRQKGLNIVSYNYERFKTRQYSEFHLHGVAIAKIGFYFKKLVQNTPFHIDWFRIEDMETLKRWSDYTEKDIIVENEFKEVLDDYCFI